MRIESGLEWWTGALQSQWKGARLRASFDSRCIELSRNVTWRCAHVCTAERAAGFACTALESGKTEPICPGQFTVWSPARSGSAESKANRQISSAILLFFERSSLPCLDLPRGKEKHTSAGLYRRRRRSGSRIQTSFQSRDPCFCYRHPSSDIRSSHA